MITTTTTTSYHRMDWVELDLFLSHTSRTWRVGHFGLDDISGGGGGNLNLEKRSLALYNDDQVTALLGMAHRVVDESPLAPRDG